MPGIEHNERTWEKYDWSGGGEEWSLAWGKPEYQWWGSLFPRVHQFLPTGTILEIAPGYGRWTRYLLPLCDRLIGVDLTARCVEACRDTFADSPHATFHKNDGRSLDMVPDGEIDFVFSVDSLVHCESDVVEAYVRQLAQKLSADGAAFIHHANLGAYRDPETGKIPFPNPGARGTTVSAAQFDRWCEAAGLCCTVQELVKWGDEDALIDCLSTVTRPDSRFARDKVRLNNPHFMAEGVRLMGDLANLTDFELPADGAELPWDLHFAPASSVVEQAVAQLVAAGRLRDATIISVLAYAGLAPGEVCRLRWRDVYAGRLDAGDRSVRLERGLAEDLERWRATFDKAPGRNALVFPGADGDHWAPGEWTAWREAVCPPLAAAHGVPTLEPGVLRHFFAAMRLERGASPWELALEMGLGVDDVVGFYGPWLARTPQLTK
jgi:hypothetical protein